MALYKLLFIYFLVGAVSQIAESDGTVSPEKRLYECTREWEKKNSAGDPNIVPREEYIAWCKDRIYGTTMSPKQLYDECIKEEMDSEDIPLVPSEEIKSYCRTKIYATEPPTMSPKQQYDECIKKLEEMDSEGTALVPREKINLAFRNGCSDICKKFGIVTNYSEVYDGICPEECDNVTQCEVAQDENGQWYVLEDCDVTQCPVIKDVIGQWHVLERESLCQFSCPNDTIRDRVLCICRPKKKSVVEVECEEPGFPGCRDGSYCDTRAGVCRDYNASIHPCLDEECLDGAACDSEINECLWTERRWHMICWPPCKRDECCDLRIMTPFKGFLVFLTIYSMIGLVECDPVECLETCSLFVEMDVNPDTCDKYQTYKKCIISKCDKKYVDRKKEFHKNFETGCGQGSPEPGQNPMQTMTGICGKDCMKDGQELEVPDLKNAGKEVCDAHKELTECMKKDANCKDQVKTQQDAYKMTCGASMISSIGLLCLLFLNLWAALVVNIF
ncbi:hypothetical protein DdX_20525 [Ditylenchus destructor]|uniref:Uncharacterized protein n=1 Tax=Ditylenchus destructor TaxID=166010 RepID=A0AAD4QRT3_9BILA|nr:hypothetical protein DdX_20525 [Ditylenchus destructor]